MIILFIAILMVTRACKRMWSWVTVSLQRARRLALRATGDSAVCCGLTIESAGLYPFFCAYSTIMIFMITCRPRSTCLLGAVPNFFLRPAAKGLSRTR